MSIKRFSSIAILALIGGCTDPASKKPPVSLQEDPPEAEKPKTKGPVGLIIPGENGLSLGMFQVTHLTYGFTDFLPLEHPFGGPIPAAEGAKTVLTGEDLAYLIKKSIRHKEWEEAEGKSLTYNNGVILAKNTEPVLRLVEKFLVGLTVISGIQHFIEARLVELSPGRAADLPRCGTMTQEELRRFWADPEHASAVRAGVSIVAHNDQKVTGSSEGRRDRSGSGSAPLLVVAARPVWNPGRGIVLEFSFRAVQETDPSNSRWCVDQFRSSWAIPDKGGCCLALGERGGSLRYLIVEARTEAPPGGSRLLDFVKDQSEPVHLALIDIRDILFKVQDFAGPEFEPTSGGRSVTGGVPFSEGTFSLGEPLEASVSQEQIVDLIKEHVSPNSWEGEFTIDLTPNRHLLVNQTPERLGVIEKFIGKLSEFGLRTSPITLRLTAIRLDGAGVAALRETLPETHFPIVFTRDLGARLLKSMGDSPVLEDASVTCWNTQRAHVLSISRIARMAKAKPKPDVGSHDALLARKSLLEITEALGKLKEGLSPEQKADYEALQRRASGLLLKTLRTDIGDLESRPWTRMGGQGAPEESESDSGALWSMDRASSGILLDVRPVSDAEGNTCLVELRSAFRRPTVGEALNSGRSAGGERSGASWATTLKIPFEGGALLGVYPLPGEKNAWALVLIRCSLNR